MNQRQVKGKWQQFLARIQVNLGLPEDNLDFLAARREQPFGKFEDHYEILGEQADKAIAAAGSTHARKELS